MNFKINLFLVFAILFLGSCGSSDDDDPIINLAQDIAGSYKGYSVAEFKYSSTPMTTDAETITLTANEDATSNISFNSSQWGKFVIKNATVSVKSGVYTITGKGITTMGMDAASSKNYDCSVTGTISSDKETVSLVFDVPAVMGGLKITFASGNAPLNMIIAGKYEGALDLSVSGKPAGTEDKSEVTIKSLDNGKSQITLKGFGVGNMLLEDIVIADVEVTWKDGSYILVGTIDTTSGTTKITGSLNGTIKEGKANIVFNIKPGSMPMSITATFINK